MIKMIDWLNSKTKLTAKKDYEFECTYIWATIATHFLCLAFWVLSLSIVSMLILGIVLMNLEFIVPELALQLSHFLGIKPSEPFPIFAVIVVDFGVLMIILIFHGQRLNALFDVVLNKLCKRIPKEQ